MFDRRLVDDVDGDYVPVSAACSAEPFHKPDHRAKKQGRPIGKPAYKRRFPKRPRDGEVIGGGHFVFRRGDSTGRVRPNEWPYEHGTADSAIAEATRLADQFGGTFDVFSRSSSVSAANGAAE